MTAPKNFTQIGWITDAETEDALVDGGLLDVEPVDNFDGTERINLNGRWDLPLRAVYVADHNPDWGDDYRIGDDQ